MMPLSQLWIYIWIAHTCIHIAETLTCQRTGILNVCLFLNICHFTVQPQQNSCILKICTRRERNSCNFSHFCCIWKIGLGQLQVGGQAVTKVLVTQMLQTDDPPKTISPFFLIITETILTLSPFLFRASGISKTSWLGCSKIQLAAKRFFGRKPNLLTHRLSMWSPFHKRHKNQRKKVKL